MNKKAFKSYTIISGVNKIYLKIPISSRVKRYLVSPCDCINLVFAKLPAPIKKYFNIIRSIKPDADKKVGPYNRNTMCFDNNNMPKVRGNTNKLI